MTTNGKTFAGFAEYLHDHYGPGQAQYILDELEKTHRRGQDTAPQCMAVKMKADLIQAYRREMLHQIKAYKALCKSESARSLDDMQERIKKGVESWKTLRVDYFLQRSCLMEHYERRRTGEIPAPHYAHAA